MDWSANSSCSGASVWKRSGSERFWLNHFMAKAENGVKKQKQKEPTDGSELSISRRFKCHERRGQQKDGGLLTPLWRSSSVAGERSRSAGVC